jgi:thiamine-monophosphate kinase
MAVTEFELISRFFSRLGAKREDVILGVGDDCALLRVPAGMELAVSVDTLVEGVHFAPHTDPESLGHKALAVNLSDLAAMGAVPAWATLALTLPDSDSVWLEAFSRGFSALAKRYRVQLIGGDTTRGPLNITVQVHGLLAPGSALRRDGARPGDLIGVTGALGDAGLALRPLQDSYHLADACNELQRRLEWPAPRVEAGQALVGIARSAIDISDGLLADLGHVAEASGVGARLQLARLPLSPGVARYVKETGDWSLPLAAGDDYELCFSVAPERRSEAEARVLRAGCELTWIGVIDEEPGVRCFTADGDLLNPLARGYEHFRPA